CSGSPRRRARNVAAPRRALTNGHVAAKFLRPLVRRAPPRTPAPCRNSIPRQEIAMPSSMRKVRLASAGLAKLAGCAGEPAQPSATGMTFFVTSAGPGNGANLGGLEGADRDCAALAKAAGAGDREWRAYLSTQGSALNDPKFVN